MSDPLRPSTRVPAVAAGLLTRVREAPPLTHCITNSVVTGFTANTLLAVGASPAMVDIVGEAGLFAGVASGLLVNLGTPTPEQRAASLEAVAGANAAGTPWVLDPVAIGALPVRTALAAELASLRPTAVRGNASEILALAGSGAGGRGVDAVDAPDAADDAARSLAARWGSVVAVSGPVDLLTDGTRVIRIANGDALLTRVTGGGCALGAVMAAFLGAARATAADALDAVASASLVYTIAAEHAARVADGPGSFAVALLDALAGLEPADIHAEARVDEGAGRIEAGAL
ncbi:hydroxyethylthiazole kinase [Microbacterium esteraromaticum]|uniref:Hydroxyethylthiazole kinase n=1 Tax=Microbacterium esteraromaticum TaxID=57043 RepID=A0A7D7WBA4_9MICO|nr:hydroxyethylthiazole kinase [Microbacterium esteraromaticum]QMU95772.1 hydroxyethylthiazole kinase [Microbacterium esteraromaticum]